MANPNEPNADDLIQTLSAQRNDALNGIAVTNASLMAARREIAELRARVAELEKPSAKRRR